MTARILVTASRKITDQGKMREGLVFLWRKIGSPPEVTLVNGACPAGGDRIADSIARDLGWHVERHPAGQRIGQFGGERFRVRNQLMVDLGASICGAWADTWASGTGMCARMARRAGIEVVDFGVDTRPRAS